MTFLPVVERELRATARRKSTYRLRFFSALGAIAIFLLNIANRHTWMSNAALAREIFNFTAGFALVFCALSGVFLTADCLSAEKREGTLGLLFLTDLRGYDVVGGKLTASSVHSLYALLGMLPVLGLPLLMGGVAAGEFWRMALVLVVTLIFSLGLGMFVSSIVRESRQAFALTLFLVIFFTGVMPAIYAVGGELAGARFGVPRMLLRPSVGYTFARSMDAYYLFGKGSLEYWKSLATVASMGIAGLLLASLMLPRSWQERAQPQTTRGQRWVPRRLRFGSARRRNARRSRFLAVNPFYWLTTRNRSSVILVWAVAVIATAACLFASVGVSRRGAPNAFGGFSFVIGIYSTFLFSMVFKYCVAMEATRRFSDDRQSGALELLLVTPLTITQMLDGQKRALRSLFGLPMGLLVVLWLMSFWAVTAQSSYEMSQIRENAIIFGGNIVCLFTDFSVLGWLGMWRGLRATKHQRAILGTLTPILVVPWLVFFFMAVLGIFDNGRPFFSFGLWFVFGLVNDLFWIQRARFKLRRQFRALAAGVAPKSDPRLEMIELAKPRRPAA